MRKPTLFFCVLVVTLFASNSAFADTFSFSFSGPVLSGSGTLAGHQSSPGIYTIFAINGTTSYGSNTYAITGVVPPGTFAGNDNLLYFPASNGLLDSDGISYEISDGSDVNLYYIDGNYAEVLVHSRPFHAFYDFVPITVTHTPTVPEPGPFILVGTGMVGIIRLFRRIYA